MKEDPATPRTPSVARRLLPVTIGLLLCAVVAFAWSLRGRPSARAAGLLERARTLHAAGHARQAERLAAEAWQLDPQLREAALILAEVALANGDSRQAAALLPHVRSQDESLRVREAFLSATLNHRQLHRLADAERDYRTVLAVAPQHVEALTGLAELLCLCARKREAAPLALQLVQLGVDTDLLVLLANEDGVVNDPDALQQARRAVPDDPNPLIGLAWHAGQALRHDEALGLLHEAVRLQPDHLAAHVALGQQLIASQRFDDLASWSQQLPASAADIGETWLVRAQGAAHAGDGHAALRCYGEAARRLPESKMAHFHFAQLLAEFGERDSSQRVARRVQRLQELDTVQNRVLLAPPPPRAGPFLELVQSYRAAGRVWEACGWCRFACSLDDCSAAGRQLLAELEREVAQLPIELVVASANVAREIDIERYPLPLFRPTGTTFQSSPTMAQKKLSFREEAASVGVAFRFFPGYLGTPTQRMFELTGGGVGVLDYDLDGWPDVSFTQGRHWPPTSTDTEHGDRLFRNRDGVRFADVTHAAGIEETGFGQGLSVGDYNADGFPDLYVANIGANQLWLNRGDGTFADATAESGLAGDAWTTSCVLADLSGDGLPDIYDVNYLTSPDVFDRVCRHADGSPKQCMPFDFFAQPDRFWLNLGDGRFREATAEMLGMTPDGTGLGVAVWDAHGEGRLSLLVANDTTPNYLFTPEPSAEGPQRLRESGVETGVAFNGEGKATGCMGVALGDVDGDGRLDIHITNFYAETNTLFVSTSPGFFEDRTQSVGLAEPSLNRLGFGTQFLDVDLDGQLELFVANGHVDDLRRQGRPYRMAAQLYRPTGPQRFVETPAAELGPYFEGEWLGRPVARVDWNRDGRDDLLVGHLENDSALLTNTTADAGRFLSLRLIGAQSNRDAIGTTVRAKIGDRTLVRQLTAGDGYQASNERRLIFGAGQAEQIDELTVQWPSGLVQRFEQVDTGSELCLREGREFLTLNR